MAMQSFKEAQEGDLLPFAVFVGKREYEGYFSNIRVDRHTLPDGWHAYNIREDGSDGEACQIVNGYKNLWLRTPGLPVGAVSPTDREIKKTAFSRR